MTRICNLLIALALLFPRFAFATGGAEEISSFLEHHSFHSARNLQRCSKELTLLANNAFLFAEYRRGESLENRIELKALCAKTRRKLYEGLYNLASSNKSFDYKVGFRAFYKVVGKDASFMQGVEFVTSTKKGVHIVYILPLCDRMSRVEKVLQSETFKNAYGHELITDSKIALHNKKFDVAVKKIEQAETVKIFTVEENLLKSKILYMAGRIIDAEKIAETLFGQARKLSADTAEKLGDLFWEMGNEEKASKAYDFALENLR